MLNHVFLEPKSAQWISTFTFLKNVFVFNKKKLVFPLRILFVSHSI